MDWVGAYHPPAAPAALFYWAEQCWADTGANTGANTGQEGIETYNLQRNPNTELTAHNATRTTQSHIVKSAWENLLRLFSAQFEI